jgi:hypothetical protein
MPQHQHSRRLAAALAAGVATVALTTPQALAGPEIGPIQRSQASESPAASPVIVRVPEEGFDWGSAAIGAGGAGALVILVTLGGVAVSSRHRVPAPR